MSEARTDFGDPSTTLLVADDEKPVTVANDSGRSPFLLIADHAGTAVPQRLGDLGVSREDMNRHIACDIGIREVGIALSTLLDATFIHQTYSRLVIDCNRSPVAEGAMPLESDHTPIPGNASLTVAERQARIAEIFQPYQDRISTEITARKRQGRPTVLVSLHSFTPVMDGFQRPWRYGVLHRGDSAFSLSVLAALRAALGEEAGDNEPYRMDDNDYTVPFHADGQAIDYLEIEIRQDRIANASGQAEVAAQLARILPGALEAEA